MTWVKPVNAVQGMANHASCIKVDKSVVNTRRCCIPGVSLDEVILPMYMYHDYNQNGEGYGEHSHIIS
jgi:hypothetical protein